MNNGPLFTVLIPTHNRGTLILKTLETVFAQTYRSYEIIVVDDASTDDTEKILQSYVKSGRIRFIKHDRNYERAQARNTGMQQASGEFLTFLDSDDLMYRHNLEDAADFIERNPDVRLFHNLYQLVDESNRVLCNFRFPPLHDPVRAITRGNFLASIGVFIHREIYRSYEFDANPVLTGSEDWDFWLRVVPRYPPGRIAKINNGVVQHAKRSTNHLQLSKLEKRFEYLVGKIRRDPELATIYKNHLRRLEAGSLLYMSTVANLTCQHTAALKFLWQAARLDVRLAGSVDFAKALGIAILRWNKGY
jgi:glycosyltransferase involved in cell wall biosynthesis